jgi:hypothetical protein
LVSSKAKMGDRRNDILYHDKTGYEQKVAVFVTDYDLAKKIMNIATNHISAGKKKTLKRNLGNFCALMQRVNFEQENQDNILTC